VPSPTIMVVPSSSSTMARILGRRSPSSPLIFSKLKSLNVLLKEDLLSALNWSKVSLLLTSISRRMLARVICSLS